MAVGAMGALVLVWLVRPSRVGLRVRQTGHPARINDSVSLRGRTPQDIVWKQPVVPCQGRTFSVAIALKGGRAFREVW